MRRWSADVSLAGARRAILRRLVAPDLGGHRRRVDWLDGVAPLSRSQVVMRHDERMLSRTKITLGTHPGCHGHRGGLPASCKVQRRFTETALL